MKKKVYTMIALMALVSFSGLLAQEMIVGGDMESADGWTVHLATPNPEPYPDYEFGYTTDSPTAGSGGCFHMSYTGQYCQVLIFQEITLQAGVEYTVSGAFKGVTNSFWSEILISTTAPVDGIDWKPKTDDNEDAIAYAFNTWQGCGENVDGTYQDDACVSILPSPYVAPGETGSDVLVYFGIKSGVYNFDVDAVSMEVMIDNVSLMGPVVAVDNKSASQYTCYPIPADNVLNISGPEITGATIHIYNINGQMVEEHTIDNSSVPVDDLAAGLYFGKIVGDNVNEIVKFVKE
ncbi:MAG: T9SS type A sorting domain-containing protein [Bacteroidales bacterium]|nr:T9SS type A sorting domain-containing protein [Bacteroidales bacterium]